MTNMQDDERTSPVSTVDGSPLRPMRPQRSSARPTASNRPVSSELLYNSDAQDSIATSKALPSPPSTSYKLPEPIQTSPSPVHSPGLYASGFLLPLQTSSSPPMERTISAPESPVLNADPLWDGESGPRRLSENQLGKRPAGTPTPPITMHWSPLALQTSQSFLQESLVEALPPSAKSVYSADSAPPDSVPPWANGAPPMASRTSSYMKTASIPSRRSSLKLARLDNGGPLHIASNGEPPPDLAVDEVEPSDASHGDRHSMHESLLSASHSSHEMEAILAAYHEGSPLKNGHGGSSPTLSYQGPPTARAMEFADSVQAYHFQDGVPSMRKMPTSSSNASVELISEIDKAIGENADIAAIRATMRHPEDAHETEYGADSSSAPPSIAFSSPPNLQLDLPGTSTDGTSVTDSEPRHSFTSYPMDLSSSTGGRAMSTDHSESNYEDVGEDGPELAKRESFKSSASTPQGDSFAGSLPNRTSVDSRPSTSTVNGFDLSRLRRTKTLPPSARYKDIVALQTTAERNAAYIQRTKELASEDTGLNTWIAFVRQRGRHSSMQPLRGYPKRASASEQSSLRLQGSRAVSYASSMISDAEFPMRGGAGRAQDLSTNAVPPSPGSSIASVPYPQLVPIQHRTSNSSLGKSGGLLAGLGRKQSKRSISSRPSISNPTLVRSSSASTPSGPRPLDDEARPMMGKRASIQSPLSNVIELHATPVDEAAVDNLADILPGVERTVLRGYLARAGGSSQADAITAYMADHGGLAGGSLL